MDPVTHTLTGAALARSGLRAATPLATAVLIVAANAPDIDVLAYRGGEYAALAHRRGWTHGPLGYVVLPLLIAGAALAWDRWVRRRRDPASPPARAAPLLLLSLIGVATHPLLDWMNTYGVRLFMPFDQRWFYGDALFIIDPWVWLILGGAVFLAGRPRGDAGRAGRTGRTGWAGWAGLAAFATALLLTAPVPTAARVVWLLGLAAIATVALVGWRAGGHAGRAVRIARSGLGLAALYILVMVLAGRVARREVRAVVAAAGIGPIEAVMVSPVPANPFAGDVVATTPTAYHRADFDWLARPRVRLRPDSIARGGVGPIVDAALTAADARRFLVWSRFPYVRVEEVPDGWAVRIGDARYADEPRAGSLSGVTIRLDRELRVR